MSNYQTIHLSLYYFTSISDLLIDIFNHRDVDDFSSSYAL